MQQQLLCFGGAAWSFLAFDVYTGTSKYVLLTATATFTSTSAFASTDDDMWKEHGNGGPALGCPFVRRSPAACHPSGPGIGVGFGIGIGN